MSSMLDPEIEALSTVCTALGTLESDDVRRRVLDFAYAKFGLKPASKSGNEDGAELDAPQDQPATANADDLLARSENGKPAENVNLIAAKLYSEYGAQSFSISEVKDLANGAGFVVPARIDMTLKGAGKKGKRLYQNLGGGNFKVTVHGEQFFKETYKVKKGTKSKLASSVTP